MNDTENMSYAKILAAIEDGIKDESQDFFANTDQNEIVIEAQRRGIAFAVELVDDLALPESALDRSAARTAREMEGLPSVGFEAHNRKAAERAAIPQAFVIPVRTTRDVLLEAGDVCYCEGVPEPVEPRGEINVIFDGPPGPEAGRFVEVEDADGKSIHAGEWIERSDGLWSLRILSPAPALLKACQKLTNIAEIVSRCDLRDWTTDHAQLASEYAAEARDAIALATAEVTS